MSSSSYKRDFPLLAGNPGFSYLDNAATTQRPEVVLDAERYFYENLNANALRGLYRLSLEAGEAVNASREHIARFLGLDDCVSACDIAFCRNASEALNFIAKSYAPLVLGPGDEVCITIMEHHSNLVPWQQVCRDVGARLVYLYPNEKGMITEEEARSKIGSRTKIVSAAHVSNVLGVCNDVRLLADIAHECGAAMVVDGAQSVSHMPVNVESLGCDFYVLSAHKAYGPMGIGVFWGRHDLLEMMPPFLSGGEMVDVVTEQDATWAPVPEKFEAGTQDAAGIYAFSVALTYLERIGFPSIQEHEQELVARCMHRLDKLGFIQLLGSDDPIDHHGLISFNVEGVHPYDVASVLDMNNVAIRAGHHCAQPLLAHLGIDSCCRVSFAIYNDDADIDRLISGLEDVWRVFR